MCEVAPRLVAAAVPVGTDSAWRTQAVTFTSTFVAVAAVGSAATSRRFVVKVPCTTEGVDNLRRQADVLAALHADPRLRGWPPVMPRCVGQGEFDGWHYWVEERLPGTPVTKTVLRRARHDGPLDTAVRLIDDFHARTSRQRLLDQAGLEAWVRGPLRRIENFYATRDRPAGLFDALDRLRGELVTVLAGHSVRTCWIHGDFWPGNLLAADRTVTGVVDWDQAQPDQLRLHDLLHLHLFSRRLMSGEELGDIVVRAVHYGIADEIGVPADQVAAWLDGIPERTAILLYWLRHVSLFIQSAGHGDSRRWLRGNVERVLARACGAGADRPPPRSHVPS